MFNQVRNFLHTMNNPIRRKIFFLNKVAPKRYIEFRNLMYTLNTQVMLGAITEEQMDSQLLAFWFHPLTHTNSSQMTVTYQRNILSTEYNGWENYETWNVALWINNDEGLYHLAMEVGNYVDFIDLLNDQGIVSTPDGVKYNDPAVNVIQLNSDVFDLWLTHKTHTVTNTLMTQSRTVTFTNVQDKVERTVEFPSYQSAYQFVTSLHIAGVDAVINLLPEDIAAWYNSLLSQEYKLGTTQFTTLFFFIMSKSVLTSLLAQGNTGSEILSILDAIVAEQSSDSGYNEPTADVIEFW